MKLRIKGNSVRLRVAPSEVKLLALGERLQESVSFSPEPSSALIYSLASGQDAESKAMFNGSCIRFVVREAELQAWCHSEDAGIRWEQELGQGKRLTVLIEKDFACLDRSDRENADTFPHPASVCR